MTDPKEFQNLKITQRGVDMLLASAEEAVNIEGERIVVTKRPDGSVILTRLGFDGIPDVSSQIVLEADQAKTLAEGIYPVDDDLRKGVGNLLLSQLKGKEREIYMGATAGLTMVAFAMGFITAIILTGIFFG